MDEMQYTTPMNDANSAQATPAPNNMKIDDHAVKKIVGAAISKVQGVLGVSGGLTDLLKSSDDVTKGIVVNMQDDDKCSIDLKLIAEYGMSVPDIVNHVTEEIVNAMHMMAGVTVDKVNVEVTDIMTRDEYQQKNNNKTAPQ